MGGPALTGAENEENPDEVESSRAPLLDHLIELRKRLIVTLAAVAAGFVVCFFLAAPIYNILLAPFEEAARALAERRGEGVDEQLRLIFTAPLEFFFVKLKLALFGAIIVAFPVIAYQVYAFVAPGLYKTERRAFLPYMVAAPVLFATGAALVYYFILPFVMRFALGQEQAGAAGRAAIELLPRVSDYLSLVTTLILAFGFSFQLPVVLSLLARVGMVNAKQLGHFRRYAVVGIFAFAAVVTPPDPLSQIGLGLAMMALYEVSILCVRLIDRQRRREEEEEVEVSSEQ